MSRSTTPLVSVLMGVYNAAKTVKASIDSILGQDYRNIEFIICDDGSSDSTVEIVESYAAMDARIVFLKNERNRGLAYTLNRCGEAAKGTYFARMDGDDISRSGRIGRQVEFLERHPEYAFCGTSVVLFDSSGPWGSLDYPERPDAHDFLLRSPFAHPTVVFRATCFKTGGGYDSSPDIGRSEDYDLFMRLYQAGLQGYNLQEHLFEYREELGSFRKRKFRYALTEARVRFRGFRRLGLLPKGFFFVLKPLFIGLIPKRLYARIRKALFEGGR